MIAEALRALGLVALEPLADAAERDPSIAARKAVESVVDGLPMDDVTSFLLERIRRAEISPDKAERMTTLLKLTGLREPVRHAVARAVLAALPSPRPGAEKAAARAAERLLKAKKDEAARSE